MKPAAWPRSGRGHGPLLVVDAAAGRWRDVRIDGLAAILEEGDLLVVNDAATVPASLAARGPAGEALELRLAGPGATEDEWWAVLFGPGDWRSRTEDRPAPPTVAERTVLAAGELKATVVAVSPLSPRLVRLRFDRRGAALWSALYRQGRPVQYSHLVGSLRLWHVQTAWAARPWAVEMPSAGWPLGGELLTRLRRAGVQLATVTHAAGLSSTGEPALDAALPLPERFEIPEPTAQAVHKTRRSRRRVVAAGTSVVRALEGATASGTLRPGAGTTDLVIDASYRPRVTDAVLTGIHEFDTSHYRLLTAFARDAVLRAAFEHAGRTGYLGHEFGDSALVLAG